MGRQINASDTCQVIYPYSCGSVFPEPIFTTVHKILYYTPIISSINESLIKKIQIISAEGCQLGEKVLSVKQI
jgi:uncharacterized Zn finger protein